MAEIVTLIALLIDFARSLVSKDRGDVADQVLSTVHAALTGTVVSLEALREVTDAVRVMVEEDRPPTETEWALLRARSDDLHDAIQGVDLGGP